MKVGKSDLSWCLNIYPGESWQEIRGNIFSNAPQVYNFLAQDSDAKANLQKSGLGLGLRLSAKAVNELHGNTALLKEELQKHKLYTFTINAFPFGNFYISPVKENVYFPDWSSAERVEYTCKTADILVDILPENTRGSISTVPVTYGKELADGVIDNLIAVARHCQEIEEKTGKLVRISLEPEPDCYLETSDEAITFFNLLRDADKELSERYLSICLDTCHMALQFEDPLEALEKLHEANVPIAKIQVSSALCYNPQEAPLAVLDKFNEEVYLHQTIVKTPNGELLHFADLGDAIEAHPDGEWRIHYHVPLPFVTNEQGLSSTSHLLTEAFFKRAFELCEHLETETYTYDILPGAEKQVNQSICEEFLFVLERSKS